MAEVFERRLNWLTQAGSIELRRGRIGLEKESLRVRTDGMIAQTPHPKALGSALTHPHITTDFSEALLEFVTPPFENSSETLHFLHDIHRFTHQQLDNELLWAASMPCVVAGDGSIPLAQFGNSNVGRFKHIYRRGLGQRYGKVMQAISGVHFNYSLPDAFWPAYRDFDGNDEPAQAFVDAAYFALIRNVYRYGWLLLYLFGCSPAVCKSFVRSVPGALDDFDQSTAYLPFATSLRMSDIGYSNNKRCGLQVRYDTLKSYLDGLRWAVTTPCEPYGEIGLQGDGEYLQLNTNVLQIENEYYSAIRPKQPPQPGERPMLALHRRGVGYVELRSIDVGMFEPAGLGETEVKFLEAFLIFCLLAGDDAIAEPERLANEHNQAEVARRGRDPSLRLLRGEREVSVPDWGLEICDGLSAICELLDQGIAERPYSRALACQRAALQEPENTPSARVLAAMREAKLGFFHFAREMSEQQRQHFLERPMAAKTRDKFVALAASSLQQQERTERDDKIDFAAYLKRYEAELNGLSDS